MRKENYLTVENTFLLKKIKIVLTQNHRTFPNVHKT